MRISQLIKELERLQGDIGDTNVQIKWTGCGGYRDCADDVQDIDELGYSLDCETNTKTLMIYSRY